MLLIIRSITFFVLIECAFAVQRPNLILINVDDLGWKDLGCYGSDVYETPNIDKLARNGLKFTNAYSACAVCSPTRAAIMTGRYPARLGVTDWIRARFQGGKIPKDRKIIMKIVMQIYWLFYSQRRLLEEVIILIIQ